MGEDFSKANFAKGQIWSSNFLIDPGQPKPHRSQDRVGKPRVFSRNMEKTAGLPAFLTKTDIENLAKPILGIAWQDVRIKQTDAAFYIPKKEILRLI
jgi:hypothetical protein